MAGFVEAVGEGRAEEPELGIDRRGLRNPVGDDVTIQGPNRCRTWLLG